MSHKTATIIPRLDDVGSFEPIVVLELFTSQGCSSCPPADILLDKAKKQYPNKIYALSYHVDYWNYIGWEDPYSKSIYTKKQRFYNQKFRYRSNYTPQLVVNGKEHFVGSNGSKLAAKISEYGKLQSENKITIPNVTKDNEYVNFDYNIEGELKDKQLRVVLVLDERTTSVKRGENRDRTLKNSNIVIAEKYIELENGKDNSTVKIPSLVAKKDKITLLLLIENETADITGAAKKAI
ncbi:MULTISPECIES: DUF1223 domain-containing protein [unclassified Croceitalea]|uniref:DUF1223 domain-containing protein n=1 Tax=unclassified Croceitalea TaxID=2632280 RepID=UPI0030D90BE5